MAAADGQRQINRVFKMQELCKAVKAVADAAPTVDAVPVVHGEWTTIEDDILMETVYQCSVCKEEFATLDDEHPTEHLWNYCPNCGAKMDGGDEDGTAQT